MKNGDYITIPKDLIFEDEVKDITISVYLLARSNKLIFGNNNKIFDREDLDINGIYCTSISEMLNVMGITGADKIKNNTRDIKKALSDLEELGLLRFFKDKYLEEEIEVKDIDKNTFMYVIDTVNEEAYTHIYETELKAILRYNTKANNHNIVRYFMYLTSKIFYGSTADSFCYSTQRKAQEEIGINKKTKTSYEDILEELEILNTVRSAGSVKTENGGYKTCKTFHCRPEDYKELNQYIKGLVKKGEVILLSEDEKERINNKRKLTMSEKSKNTIGV